MDHAIIANRMNPEPVCGSYQVTDAIIPYGERRSWARTCGESAL